MSTTAVPRDTKPLTFLTFTEPPRQPYYWDTKPLTFTEPAAERTVHVGPGFVDAEAVAVGSAPAVRVDVVVALVDCAVGHRHVGGRNGGAGGQGHQALRTDSDDDDDDVDMMMMMMLLMMMMMMMMMLLMMMIIMI